METRPKWQHPKAVSQMGRPNRWYQQSWPAKMRKICILALGAFGITQMISQSWPMGIVVTVNLDKSQPEYDVHPDTDYPLRPADEPWDISTSYPYSRKLSTTVTEGTWLRIATHPTRPEIVFDMLGDLYCMDTEEAAGAETTTAHPILAGVPYDKEAEFSADGSQLVFISDAGFGVDNIWTLPYTTCRNMAERQANGDARGMAIQQTNSTFRFFSSPAFHPSHPKIVATKWFLSGRPNGAGEIWEFPLLPERVENLPERGGRRVVERKLPASWPASRYFESQLGSEQARYAPSGDAIIYSRHVQDDDTGKFSYNKDVHAGINAVFQLNTTTGEVKELVAAAASAPNKPASPGGANMPRLSRDGKTLSFVRRKDDKEVLVLKDMQTGSVHYVWDGLSYDLSTIPAFMGAYPNYGWTANDTAIVVWAEGQVWRVPIAVNHLGARVAAGHPQKLAFKAKIDLDLGPTRYSERDIRRQALSSTVETRSFRGLRSNTAGDKIVVEAAGDNYIAEISSPSLRPVTRPAASTSCYAPSFVPGTPYILQACWSDTNFTSFHLSDPDEGSCIKIHGLPRGRYISPVSNGKQIAFVRTGKDYMFGDVDETFGEGVWIGDISLPGHAASRGTKEALLTNLRQVPGLGVASDTKLDMGVIGSEQVILVQSAGSVSRYSLQTGKLEASFKSSTAVEMTISTIESPAVAFRDFQHVWMSSAAHISNRLEIWTKPGDPRTPRGLTRLSQIGGHDATFSGDGSKVFWLLGPTLYHVDVAEALQACHGASLSSRDLGNCSLPFVQSRLLNVSHTTGLCHQIEASGGRPFAITNATLVSMSGSKPAIVQNAVVIVDRGQIIAAQAASEVEIPKHAQVLDAQGGAVLPGYVDVHGHWGGFLSPYPLQSWEMETFLGYGVTTIHNPASRNVFGHVERLLIDKGRMYGPRVFHTGDVLYGSTQPSVYTEINSRADARDALLRIKVEGGEASFTVKNYQLVPRSSRQRLLLEAEKLDMLVVPEGGWSFDWGLTYFIDGYTSHEHPLPIPQLYDDVLSLIAESGSSYTPLAVMNYGGIFGQHWIHQTAQIPRDAKLRSYVRHDILESLTEVKQAPESSYLMFNTTRSTAKLARRGVRTNIGAHGEQPIGFLYHGEMRMMAQGGQEPYEILRHATIGGATSLGLQSAIGSLEEGKLADLVIYPPGVDTVEKVFNSSMHMKYVMRGGTLYGVENGLTELWPRTNRTQARARLNAEDDE